MQPAPGLAATTRKLLPRACATLGPPPIAPLPRPALSPRPFQRRVAAGPHPRPGRGASGLRRRLSAGTWRRGPAGAEQSGRAGSGRRGRGVGTAREGTSAPPRDRPGPLRELRPSARAGRVAPPRGSWRRAGRAILGRGVGRPVPGLELLVINGPQLLAICLHVQSLTEQEILEALAGLPELPAAELAGHRGGGCGPSRGSVEMKLKVAAAAGSWLP